MSDQRAVLTWGPIDGHSGQIVGSLDPDTRSEQWLPECSCGWIGSVCGTSAVAQTEIRAHLLVEAV